jgi:membrane fusion protein, multidrug efflux system
MPDPTIASAQSTGAWRLLRGLAVVATLVAAAAAVVALARNRQSQTDDAYITGHVHSVASRIAGTVTEVLIDDNQKVESGQVLARLDRRDYVVRASLARAQIAQAEAQGRAAQSQVQQAEAQLLAAHATLRRTELDDARNAELINHAPAGISRQEFDATHAAHDSARAGVDAVVAQRSMAVAAIAAAAALRASGEASLADAELALSYTDVRAPVAGRVGHKTLEVGEHVGVGQTMLSIVGDDLWVVANFREVQLAQLHVGDAIDLSVDALPGRSLEGKVESFSPATGSQFSLLPPDNATGNFTKIVQRLPVKIRFDPAALGRDRDAVAPGMSVVARIPTR